jgi:hypothetical protein
MVCDDLAVGLGALTASARVTRNTRVTSTVAVAPSHEVGKE